MYSMKDLKILSSQNDFIEYFEHAKDIIPSKRSNKWKKMTSDLGIRFVKSLLKKETPLTKKEQQVLDKISNWAIFKKNEIFFMEKRPLSLSSIEKCLSLKNEANCLTLAKNIFIKDPAPEFGIEILKKFKSQKSKNLEIFILPMLKSNICSFYINNSPLKDIVKKLFETNSKFFIDTNIEKDCREDLSKNLLKDLYLTESNIARKNIMHTLRKWGKLHSNDIYYYNMAQFLDDYQFPKELILTKWKTFKTLGKNERVRTIVLKKLLTRRPLHGKILYNNSKESKAILSAIKRYIPEYFLEYANICIDYFKGKKPAPSTDCHQLFKKSQAADFFNKQKYMEYKRIMSAWKKK